MDMIFREGVFYDGLVPDNKKEALRASPLWALVTTMHKNSLTDLRVSAVMNPYNQITAYMVDKHGGHCLTVGYNNANQQFSIRNAAHVMKKRGHDRNLVTSKSVSYVTPPFKQEVLKAVMHKRATEFSNRLAAIVPLYKKLADIGTYSIRDYCDKPVHFDALFGVLFEQKSLDMFAPDTVRALDRAYRYYSAWREKRDELYAEVDETFGKEFLYIGHHNIYIGVGVYKYVDGNPHAVIPYRLYKSFDALPDEMRERTQMSMTICRLNREQTGVSCKERDGVPFAWEDMIFRDTNSMITGAAEPSMYEPSVLVAPY